MDDCLKKVEILEKAFGIVQNSVEQLGDVVQHIRNDMTNVPGVNANRGKYFLHEVHHTIRLKGQHHKVTTTNSKTQLRKKNGMNSDPV